MLNPKTWTKLRAGLVGAAALLLAGILLAGTSSHTAPHPPFRLTLRTEVQAFKGIGVWKEARFNQEFVPRQCAIIICDMWDRHWCKGADRRFHVLARKIEPFLQRARAAGILIIHSPSETMNFYKDYPQRRKMLSLARVRPPASLGLKSPALPIDDADGGCATPGDFSHPVWTRENPVLKIEPGDYISDNGEEIYSLLKARGIRNVFYVGVAANMCILDRSFGIKQMANWGVHCILVRDLTDTMYNPEKPPHVSHAEGTALVIQYIEKYWCPTTLSTELTRALKR